MMILATRTLAAFIVVAVAIAQDEPCCQGACSNTTKKKYYSIAKPLFGGEEHCGEACIDPTDYKLEHFFERNLTLASTDSPCKTFGYAKYDSTVTHGFGPVKITLDLYDEQAPANTTGLFPPPIAPVWPTVFSSKSFGSVDFKGSDPMKGGHKNFTCDWYYDWPHSRHLFNGTETFYLPNGTEDHTVTYIRTWHGPTASKPSSPVTLCDITTHTTAAPSAGPSCKCTNFPKFLLSGIERPDGFVRSHMTLVQRENVHLAPSNISIQADHYTGPVFKSISPAPFEVWQDPLTNFPVLFTGPVGYQGDTGYRYYESVRAYGESDVHESIFDLDLSFCKNGYSEVIEASKLPGPSMWEEWVSAMASVKSTVKN